MKQRLSILLIWFFAIWSLLVIRGLQIQLYPSHNLDQAGQKQYQRIVKLYSKRGDIFDRNGQELAISVPASSLFADPLLIKSPRRLAQKMAQILPQSQKTLYKKLSKKNSRFVWIQRLLDENTKKKILALNEKGLGFKDEFKRVYPNKNLLAHTVGFVGADGHGLEGIEARYDAKLSAEEQIMNLPKDARGRFLVEDGWLFMQNRDGEDIYLTIDADLQYYTQQELKKALTHHNAEAAWALVMNPKTGEILAMASLPDYDVNNVGSASKEARRNRITTDMYEPGSTMKTIFLAAAMKNNIVQANSVIDTSTGQIEIDKRVIRESDAHHTFEKLSTTEVLANSSNVGISKISLKMKDKMIFEEYRNFGFGEKTGIDLLGESKGIFAKPPWRDHHKANISFGHGIAVTAMQMANAYAAIANKGNLQRPILVKSQKEILNQHASIDRHIRRVLSEKEAERIKMMLVASTAENATGKSARVKGYPVAGKTGTAQKVDPNGRGYLKGQYVSSFIGFLPANDPEFLIYVVVDSPRDHGYYGSETAAPIFSKIAQYAINKRGLAPVQIAKEDLIKPREEVPVLVNVEGETLVPNMKGWALRDVLRYVQKEKIDLNLIGRKGRVVKTSPAVGETWTDDKKLKVYLE